MRTAYQNLPNTFLIMTIQSLPQLNEVRSALLERLYQVESRIDVYKSRKNEQWEKWQKPMLQKANVIREMITAADLEIQTIKDAQHD